ncbi:hypothetical protein QJS04_geneDACA008868 [Acorus gramineus]|uniref:CS domain-containing protein n=1 Tax=Acorus gramineus TaxID=55184 RepID=A0AAV9ACY4_ACOGR|nr:hypothetical protein QJS04_geneDACA008868 [Acorus gramineus]
MEEVRVVKLLNNDDPIIYSSTTRPYRIRSLTSQRPQAELRLPLQGRDIQSSQDVFIDVKENSLTIKVHSSGSIVTLMETDLYDKIKPSETIWYIDEDQLVVNLKKHDSDLKWPDVKETWASLTTGVLQLLKGTSVYTVGESTEVNEIVAKELAVGLGYTPLNTSELLERYVKQSIDSWMIAEGADSVAEAEATILESLSSHVRAAVGTLGEPFGAAGRADKWQHLHSGFAIWLSQCDTTDEASAKEEARRHIQDGNLAYSNADMVVKLGGWDPDHARTVAQTCLSALKQLILSDRTLTGKKSLYIRLGCRGDWPNIKPPGWDPSTGADVTIRTHVFMHDWDREVEKVCVENLIESLTGLATRILSMENMVVGCSQ